VDTKPTPQRLRPRQGPARLVSTRVSALPPGTYTDPGQTGLQLRVHQKQGGYSRTWLLRFKFRGEESRILLGHFPETTLDAARGLARDYREKAAQGIDPRRARPRRRQRSPQSSSAAVAPGPARHSIEFLASEYLERHVMPNRKRPDYVARILDKDVLPTWKGRDARTIEAHEVIESVRPFENRVSALRESIGVLKGKQAVALAYVLESIERTGAYATDVAELAVNNAVRTQ